MNIVTERSLKQKRLRLFIILSSIIFTCISLALLICFSTYALAAGQPTVTSSAATNVHNDWATLNGDVTVFNDTQITDEGFVWDTVSHGNPGNVAPGASGYASSWNAGAGPYSLGTFSHQITGLLSGQTIYWRAWALNDAGFYGYSDPELSFTTTNTDRFWVISGGSGTGNWDASTTTHWSLDTGGAAGASVPTSSNNVYFDANSFNGAGQTMTITATANCLTLDWSAVTNTPTWAGSSALNIYGSFVGGTLTHTYTGTITWAATTSQTITTDGLTLDDAQTFNGIGGTWVNQDTFNAGAATITLTNGTWNTNGQIITSGAFTTASGTNSLSLGASVFNVSGSSGWNAGSLNSITAGTSSIRLTGTSAPFSGNGLTYYEVQMNGQTQTMSGTDTFTNLIKNGVAVANDSLTISNNIAITGTLTLAGNSVGNRLALKSNTTSLRTVTSASNTFSNVDFYYIQGSGAGNWNVTAITGGSANMGGNTGITFNNKSYWVGNSGSWVSQANAHWAGSSGGSPNSDWLPNFQVSIYFDSNSFTTTSQSTTVDASTSCNSMDWTGVSNNPSIKGSASGDVTLSIYGSVTVNSGMSIQASGYLMTLSFVSSSSQTITTGGASIAGVTLVFNNASGSWTLQDAITITSYGSGYCFSVTAGTFNTNGKAVNITGNNGVQLNGGILNLAASIITMSSDIANAWSATSGTLNAGTSTIALSSGTNALTFAGGGYTYNNVTWTAATSAHPSLVITGANTFSNLTAVGGAFTGSTLSFGATEIVSNTFTLTGYSGVYRLAFGSSTAGVQRQITVNGSNVITNTNISDSAVVGTASPNISAGLNSDFGDNLGWIFTTGTNQYWVGNSGNWSDVTHWASTSGGPGGTGRIPLIQDTAIFDGNSTSISGRTITIDVPNLSGIDTSTVTNDPTLSSSAEVDIYGSINWGTAIWNNTSGGTWFKGGNTISVTAAGIYTFTTAGLYIATTAATLTPVNLNSNFNVNGHVYLRSGTFNLNSFTLTAQDFDSSTTTSARAFNMNAGTITLNDAGAVTKWNVNTTNLNIYPGTSSIILTSSAANAQTFTGGGTTYNNLTIQGTGNYPLTMTSSDTFNFFIVDRSQAAKTIKVTNGVTITASQFAFPVSGTTVLTLTNTSSNGVWTLRQTSGQVSTDYIAVQWGVTTGGATFYAGTDSTIMEATMTNGTGVVTGSPVSLFEGITNTPTVTTVGTFTVLLTSSVESGTATSGPSVLVTGSPKALVAGSQSITTTGVPPGTIDITLTGSGWLTSSPTAPTIVTTSATDLTKVSATVNGAISAMGGYAIVYGYFHWGTSPTLATYSSTSPMSTVNSPGSFSFGLTGLATETTYYFQAVASDGSADTALGSILSFTTLGAPVVATSSAIGVGSSTATLQGVLTSLGNYSSVSAYFEYGPTIGYGSQTPYQTLSSIQSFNATISGLVNNQTYHFRADILYNGGLIVSGTDLIFTTSSLIAPTVITDPVTNLSTTSATLVGTLSSIGQYSAVSVYFNWGLTVAYGNQLKLQSLTAPSTFQENISGLTANTQYHYQAVVLYNDGSTAVGSDTTFTTESSTTVANPDSGPYLIDGSVNAYENEEVAGDIMIVAEYNIPYANLPSVPVDQTFLMRYINPSGTTVQTASIYPYQKLGYGYGVATFYWDPSDPNIPTWGEAGTVELIGNPTINWNSTTPVATHTMIASDWVASTTTPIARAQLGNNIVSNISPDLQHDWGLVLTAVSGAGTVLNTTYGQLYFSNVIPFFTTVCATILTTSPLEPVNPPSPTPYIRTYGQSLQQIWMNSILGPSIQAAANSVNVGTDTWLLMVFLIVSISFLCLAAYQLEIPQAIPLLFIPIFVGGIRIGVVPMDLGVAVCSILFIISMFLLIQRRAAV